MKGTYNDIFNIKTCLQSHLRTHWLASITISEYTISKFRINEVLWVQYLTNLQDQGHNSKIAGAYQLKAMNMGGGGGEGILSSNSPDQM